MTLRVAYLGNFEPEHSTENDLYRTMSDMGVAVTRLQEQKVELWESLLESLTFGGTYDAVMWTRTKDLSEQVPADLRRRVQIEARLVDVPMIGVHLDRWWGLGREPDLYNDPFFRCQYLFTADDHSPERWKALGANHHWMPPAIAPHNVGVGKRRQRFRSEIAFVGSHEGYGHTEWKHRGELVQFLKRNYAGRVKFWPQPNEGAVRGDDLKDLYASVKVVVGDSCLVPDGLNPWTRYCSDRVFETIGRGAFLLHPRVDGITTDERSGMTGLLRSEGHLGTWELWDWDELGEALDHHLEYDDIRNAIAEDGMKHVKRYHTYKNRLEKIFKIVGLKL